ncbi:MAG TPA: cobyrinate a,c-diamide synthase, partial [Ruminococcus sp.]|nr:cobyrinate a,c-diamide synthase [Ruminococcus sp.]
MQKMIPRLLISAVGSGTGKTTVTAALLSAFCARGMRVQSLKCGPDYI